MLECDPPEARDSFQLRDLRRTCETQMAALKISRDGARTAANDPAFDSRLNCNQRPNRNYKAAPTGANRKASNSGRKRKGPAGDFIREKPSFSMGELLADPHARCIS
jgi:hypothetical protein